MKNGKEAFAVFDCAPRRTSVCESFSLCLVSKEPQSVQAARRRARGTRKSVSNRTRAGNESSDLGFLPRRTSSRSDERVQAAQKLAFDPPTVPKALSLEVPDETRSPEGLLRLALQLEAAQRRVSRARLSTLSRFFFRPHLSTFS